ncbi:hypothetical protein ACQB60_26255 [Actinomycetota bacterium Odt1-20B]
MTEPHRDECAFTYSLDFLPGWVSLTASALAEGDAVVLKGAFYADSGVEAATLDVKVYGEEGVRPTPEELQPLLLEWKDAQVVSEPEVSYLELPAGPAVRVQATVKTKGVLGFGGRLVEFIRYAVCPTINDDAVVVTGRWGTASDSGELTRMVDEMMPSLQVTADDAHADGR